MPPGIIGNTVSLPRVVPDGGGGATLLAEMGTNVLEFSAVARIAGDDKYRLAAEKGLRAVHTANDNVGGARELGVGRSVAGMGRRCSVRVVVVAGCPH